MRIQSLLIGTCCCLCFAAESHAWGPAGHKIVASIAFRRLSEGKQAKIIGILKRHPRYQRDFTARMPGGLNDRDSSEWIVQQAAIWPDMTKELRADIRDKYDHGTWHYINLPYFLTEADKEALSGQIRSKTNLAFDVPGNPELQKSMNIIQAIAHSKTIAMDAGADPEQRALHVSWLIHLVGDLHQPLHSTELFSRRLFPNGDQGGNKVRTVQRLTLHIFWDLLPGNSRFSTTRAEAIDFMQNPQMRELGTQAAANQQVTDWLDESHVLAKTVAYDAEVTGFLREVEQSPTDAEPTRISLSEAYVNQARTVANRRLVQAGYRLGRMLEALP